MAEKLMQNRTVVIGRSPADASNYAIENHLEGAVLVSASHHRLTISGSLAGMHIGALYVTPTAPEGQNFEVAKDMIARAQQKNPDIKLVEEPRAVSAL